MDRRRFVGTVGTGAIVSLAGCGAVENGEPTDDATPEDDGDEIDDEPESDGSLRIATYNSMVTGDTPAGEWITDQFEQQVPDADLEWTIPTSGIDHYVRRTRLDGEIDADVYLGLSVDDLVYADTTASRVLFDELERSQLENADRIREDLAFDDPDERVLPVATGYVTPVYDGERLESPETLDSLLEDAYEDTLIVQDPRYSIPGRAFLLWTIETYGDDYLEYWRALADNGLEIATSWTETYRESFLEGNRPMVVSYSTDRVGAALAGHSLERHQVATPDGQGYRSTEAVAIFEGTDERDLALEFIDFLLEPETQAELATRNVQFPAIESDDLDLDDAFDEHAVEPEETVTMTYADLSANLEGWLEAWVDEIPE